MEKYHCKFCFNWGLPNIVKRIVGWKHPYYIQLHMWVQPSAEFGHRGIVSSANIKACFPNQYSLGVCWWGWSTWLSAFIFTAWRFSIPGILSAWSTWRRGPSFLPEFPHRQSFESTVNGWVQWSLGPRQKAGHLGTVGLQDARCFSLKAGPSCHNRRSSISLYGFNYKAVQCLILFQIQAPSLDAWNLTHEIRMPGPKSLKKSDWFSVGMLELSCSSDLVN